MGSFGTCQMFEPIRYRLRVITSIPPTGVPGDVYLYFDGTSYTIIYWNQITGTFISPSSGGTGADYDTDVGGAVSFGADFTSKQLWIPVNPDPAMFTFTNNLNGLKIESVGPASATVARRFAGIVCRKKLLPNAAGIIEISFMFDQLLISNPAANKEWFVGGQCAAGFSNGGLQDYVGMGAHATAAIPHGEYAVYNQVSLEDTFSPNLYAGGGGDEATNITSFRVRCSFDNSPNFGAVSKLYHQRADLATKEHNMGASAPIYAVAPVGYEGNAAIGEYWAINQGLTLTLGVWNMNQMVAAGFRARLITITLWQGRLIG